MKRKILSVLLIILLFALSIIPVVYGIETDEALSNILNTEATGNIPTRATTIAGTVIAVFQVVGVGIAIIMLLVLAMKYMMSAPGDKAEIKKHAVPYVVGAICLFAASGILGILEKFANNINSVK